MTIDWSQVKTAETRAAEALAARRASMTCTRLQGRLALGPDVCAALDAAADDPDTPWAMREAIRHAQEWRRNSETVDELAWVLGFSDEQMDALFEHAATMNV